MASIGSVRVDARGAFADLNVELRLTHLRESRLRLWLGVKLLRLVRRLLRCDILIHNGPSTEHTGMRSDP